MRLVRPVGESRARLMRASVSPQGNPLPKLKGTQLHEAIEHLYKLMVQHQPPDYEPEEFAAPFLKVVWAGGPGTRVPRA